MNALTASSTAQRAGPLLRRAGDAMPSASIGAVPILWNNVDIVDLRHGTEPATILDEIARIGYEGTQLGLGFPEGDALRTALAERNLRLAEVYASLRATMDGPTDDALAVGRERLRLLHDAGGEVLCLALDSSPAREERAGRASTSGTPTLTEDGWAGLVEVIEAIAREARDLGHRTVFHPHAGTFVETPAEVERFVGSTNADLVGICLDVGHLIVGGGDPISMLTVLGERVTHIHLKDVDRGVLSRLQAGDLPGFGAAIRERLFTELGAGVLDLDGVIATLVARDYDGWLMVEQDSCWGPPSESAAIGRRILGAALRRAGSGLSR